MSLNYFDELFFAKYVKSDDEVIEVCHKHPIWIIDDILIWMFFWVILPSFFYYNNTFNSNNLVDFIYFESFVIFIYLVLMYKIFDWYNDSWIITSNWIIDLDWQLFKANIVYIDFDDIKWIELQQSSIWDWFLDKANIIIHLEGENSTFILEDAKSPKNIVWFIQEVIEEKQKAAEEEDQTSFEFLINTLKKVVKDHLVEGKEVEDNNKDDIEKVLNKKWTVDLRDMK